MSEHNLNSLPPDDPLDELLQRAAWPEPDQQRLARLEREWGQSSANSTRLKPDKITLRVFVFIAACLCVAIGIWWFSTPREDQPAGANIAEEHANPGHDPVQQDPVTPEIENNHDGETSKADAESLAASPGEGTSSTDDRKSLNATKAEAAIATGKFSSDVDRFVAYVTVKQAKDRRERSLESLTQLIETRARDPQFPLATRLRAAGWTNAELRQSFEQLLRQRSDHIAQLAIQLLVDDGSDDVVAFLLRLAREGTNTPAILAHLPRRLDVEQLTQLVESPDYVDYRPALIRELFQRGDQRSLRIFFDFVQRVDTSEAALAAVQQSDSPPQALLFQTLAQGKTADRLTAAHVLGKLPQSDVIDRLLSLAETNRYDPATVVALVTSSNARVQRRVAELRGDQQFAAVLKRIQMQWQEVASNP